MQLADLMRQIRKLTFIALHQALFSKRNHLNLDYLYILSTHNF